MFVKLDRLTGKNNFLSPVTNRKWSRLVFWVKGSKLTGRLPLSRLPDSWNQRNNAVKIATKSCVFAFAIVCFLGVPSAEAGNGWGWSKPMNKKVGSPFYTSNKNINNSYGFRSKAWKQSNLNTTYSQRMSTQRANAHQTKVIKKVPTPVVTAEPVVTLPPAPTAAVQIVSPKKALVPMQSVFGGSGTVADAKTCHAGGQGRQHASGLAGQLSGPRSWNLRARKLKSRVILREI